MKIAAGQFKAKCLKLMDDVQKYHKEIIITKYGKPVAKLTPVEEEAPEPLFGFLKDSVVITGDIVKPTGEKWNADE
jgi:prevent-host-death family protein